MLSLPYSPRVVQATEARLQKIYDAANIGLKGDSLALAAGMLPSEYRQLCQMDPLADMAALKGRAALAILQHVYGWTAKQEISVDVYQKISITQALLEAQGRVIDG